MRCIGAIFAERKRSEAECQRRKIRPNYRAFIHPREKHHPEVGLRLACRKYFLFFLRNIIFSLVCQSMVKKVRSIKTQSKLNERQKRQVKRLIGSRVETKHINVHTTTSVTGAGYIGDVTYCAQGLDDHQRVGTEIMLKSLNLNYLIRCGDETNELRVMLVQWMEDTKNGILPTFQDVLNPNAPSYLTAQHNFLDAKPFKVLYDRIHSLAGDGAVGGGTYVISPYGPASVTHNRVRIFGKKLSKKVHFEEGPDPEVDGLNKIYLMMISDSPGISLVHPSVEYDCLINFTDA